MLEKSPTVMALTCGSNSNVIFFFNICLNYSMYFGSTCEKIIVSCNVLGPETGPFKFKAFLGSLKAGLK